MSTGEVTVCNGDKGRAGQSGTVCGYMCTQAGTSRVQGAIFQCLEYLSVSSSSAKLDLISQPFSKRLKLFEDLDAGERAIAGGLCMQKRKRASSAR